MTVKTQRGTDAKVSNCMWQFVEFAARHKPVMAVFESVQQAFTNTAGLGMMRALRERMEDRTGLRYGLWHIKHNAYSVGGPSQRRRYFWLVSQVPFGVEEPVLHKAPLLNDILSDLEPLPLTWQYQPYRVPAHEYTQHLVSSSGVVDGHIGLDVALTRRITQLADAIEWRPRESISSVTKRYYETYGRLPDWYTDDQAHKLLGKDFKMGFTIPARWDGERHARVITGGGLVMVIHPRLNRCITHREAARILGFPDDWKILPLRRLGNSLGPTWGKGITVHCGKWIGGWMKTALDGAPGSVTGTPMGDREWVIDVTNTWQRHTTVPNPVNNLVRSMI